MNRLTWLFFDIGSTLVEDGEAYRAWFECASALVGGALSPQEVAAGYAQGMANLCPTVAGLLRPYGFTGETTSHLYHPELERPYPEAAAVLAQLARRYRLGIIANQLPGAQARLESFGLRPYFQVILSSAEAGVSKPDPQIFTLALKLAGCVAEEAAMIGDRLDNDIYPAKALGFTTVRILQGFGRLQTPPSPAYAPDFTVGSLAELPAIL